MMDLSFFCPYGPCIQRRPMSVRRMEFVASLDSLPIAEGMNGGFFAYPVRKKTTTDSSDSGSYETFANGQIEVHSMKDLSVTFPLQKTPYAIPVHTGKYRKVYNHLKQTLPKNCISSYTKNNQTHVVHVSSTSDGRSTSKVDLMLSQLSIQGKKSHKRLCTFGEPKRIRTIKEILSVDTQVYGDNSTILLVTKPEAYVMRNECATPVAILPCNTKDIIDASLHPVVENFLCIAEQSGTTHLIDINKDCPLWIGDVRDDCSNIMDDKIACRFGDHPLSMYLGMGGSLFIIDTREAAYAPTRCLFKSHGTQRVESIDSFINVPGRPYVYVNTSASIHLMDERWQKTPILVQNHMLQGSPESAQLFNVHDNEYLAVLDHQSGVVSMSATNWQDAHSANEYIVKGISSSKHFNSLCDSLALAHKSDLCLNTRTAKRFNSSCIGMTSLMYEGEPWFLLSTDYGDIFAQQFHVEGDRQSVFGSTVQNLYAQFESEIENMNAPLSSHERCKYHPDHQLQMREETVRAATKLCAADIEGPGCKWEIGQFIRKQDRNDSENMPDKWHSINDILQEDYSTYSDQGSPALLDLWKS